MGWSGWVGVVDSRMSPGFDMTGFYWEMGWVHQRRVKPPGQPILVVLEVVDNLGQGVNRGFVGKLGWMGLVVVRTMVMVAVWLGGWGVGMVFKSRCSINN